ncbi:MAG: putative dinucleotide-utilizing enzyme, partial [Gammaproteobacteria bacterium]
MRIGLIGLGGMGKVVVAALNNDKTALAHKMVGAIVAPEDLFQARKSNNFELQ